MRLLFVCPALDTGGQERHWSLLLPALAARDAEPHLLTLSSEGALFAEVVAAGVPARCAGLRGRIDPRGLRRALAAAASARPEVVVSYGVSGQLVAQAIARRAGARHVLNEHTPCTADGALLAPRPHQRALLRLLAPRVDAVIAVARAQVDPLTRRGYRRETIRVIPNGVFGGRLEPSRPREEVRAALGAADGGFLALAVSALRPEKRVDAFVDAVALARRSRPEVRGAVAGDGAELDGLRARAGDGVALLGARQDVADLLDASDVVCLPSAAEALPMAVLEAMALGRPVVASDVGGTRDAVVDGETGMLVAPGDARGMAAALAELAADPARAERMGKAGRDRQRERFDGERMADAYLRAFDELAS
jgi:glycosyltransferase involved in cell wall biosynthesis